MIKLRFLVLFISLVSSTVFSQENITVEKLIELYPDDKAIFTNKEDHLIITTKKNTYEVRSEIVEEIMYLSDRSDSYASNSIYFGSFKKIKNIKAQSWEKLKGKNKFKKRKVSYFPVSDVQSSGIFYDDQKKIDFTFDGITKGSKSKLTYSEYHKEPKLLGRSFFVYGIPALRSEISVTFPENVEVGYKTFNVDEALVRFEKVKKGKLTTYKWVSRNAKGLKFFNDAPNFSYYGPHVVIFIKKIKLKDSVVEVLPDVNALYNWYYSLVDSVNLKKDKVLENIVDSITDGVAKNDEKARLIFNWVQDNIKYVAFEDGMGGFVPRPASAVCQKRYGDCKDMASIITEMLGYAGIDGDLTWIGSRKLPYKYSEIHTPVVDNHMIASYSNEKGERIFLDAVGSYTPYGYPTGFIQGKEALISISKDSFEIQKVPIVSRDRNEYVENLHLTIDGTNIKGTGVVQAKGYAKLDLVYPLINLSGKKRKEKLNEYIKKGSNKFLIKEADYKGLADRDLPLSINYKFSLDDYAHETADELYVNLNLEKTLKNEKIDVEKREGISFKYAYAQDLTSNVSIKIPKKYKVTFTPPNSKYQGDSFGYTLEYKRTSEGLTLSFKFYRDILHMDEELFEQWNKMVEQANKAYKEVVILKRRTKR